MKDSTLIIAAVVIAGAIFTNGYLDRRAIFENGGLDRLAADAERVEFINRCHDMLRARYERLAEMDPEIMDGVNREASAQRKCDRAWYWSRLRVGYEIN